jgi:AraC-like DNA-binding protein
LITDVRTSASTPVRHGPCTEVEIGHVRVSVLRFAVPDSSRACAVRRCISRRGSRAWHLVLAKDGPLVVGSGGSGVRLEPGWLMLWAPHRPLAAWPGGCERPPRGTVLSLPCAALPIPDHVLGALAARPLPADHGPGALLVTFLDGVAGQEAAIDAAQGAWLGSAAVHLAVAFLTGMDGVQDVGWRSSRGAALMRDVKVYIERHLGNPALSPKLIATAHHISVRYLHHLFRQEELTVSSFIRELRLERCRADLAGPQAAELSVGQVGARWGYTDAAVFGRTFKRTYGVAPGEYRKQRAAS